MSMKVRIVPSIVWQHRTTGQRASIYGAVPWTSPYAMPFWEKRQIGWTTFNVNENTYGFGREPFATKEGIEAFLKAHPDQFEIVP